MTSPLDIPQLIVLKHVLSVIFNCLKVDVKWAVREGKTG